MSYENASVVSNILRHGYSFLGVDLTDGMGAKKITPRAPRSPVVLACRTRLRIKITFVLQAK